MQKQRQRAQAGCRLTTPRQRGYGRPVPPRFCYGSPPGLVTGMKQKSYAGQRHPTDVPTRPMSTTFAELNPGIPGGSLNAHQ